jgi:serine beta-lactamase-like protein LACTB
MRQTLLMTLLLLLSSLTSYTQILIKGTIVNKATLEPISYANVGIRHKNIGTISNLDGSFSIVIPDHLSKDTVTISSLGYKERHIPLFFFQKTKPTTVYLNEKSKTLLPVTVNARQKTLFFEVGNKAVRSGNLETDTTHSGRAIALLIENKAPYYQKDLSFPAYIEKARLRIFRNNLKSFKFRVRINDVDSLNGSPGRDLLHESIVIQSTMKKGWLTFDLSALNIEIAKPFFITFEQITDLQDRIEIANGYRDYLTNHPKKLITDTIVFEGKKEVRQILGGGIDLPGTFIAMSNSASRLANYACFIRETSFGEWKKVPDIVTATVTLSNKVNSNSNVRSVPACSVTDIACQAQRLCSNFMDETDMYGMQIAVSRKGQTIWSSNLGYADFKNQITVTDSTLFRINSISKSITSLALIKLVAEQKLDLDAPIQKYVPHFPLKQHAITTRQLAGHLAGFRDYKKNDLSDYIRTEHFTTVTQAISLFQNDTLLFKPGSQFSYSTFGWNLIGAVIEGASGENYVNYMSNHIWQPLKLFNTLEDNYYKRHPNRSQFYDATGTENDLGDLSYKYPGGGLLSTASDLIKMGNELLYGNYINPMLKPILFESQYTLDRKKTNYGLGWYIGLDKNGHRIWHHAGDSFSGSSNLIIYPDDDLVIAFLANSQEGVNFDIQAIGALFYKK